MAERKRLVEKRKGKPEPDRKTGKPTKKGKRKRTLTKRSWDLFDSKSKKKGVNSG